MEDWGLPISASYSETDKNKKMQKSIEIAKNAAMSFRLRSVVARIKKAVDEGNVYGEKVAKERFEELMAQLEKNNEG